MSATEHIVAVGAGRMGRGIAQVMAFAGFDVTLLDLKARTADAARALADAALGEVVTNLRTLADLGVLAHAEVGTVTARIRVAGPAEAADVLASADVIFEGVPEVMTVKAEVLARVALHARADALVASTTSTFSADALAGFISYPQRFANAHWLNPAFLIPVVEVSPTERTAEATVERLMELLTRAGKMPVRCRPSPGFIVPRIQALAMNEAARLVEDGVAEPHAIDTATRYGFGVRFAVLGLLEFIDYGGGEILYHASRYLSETLPSDRHVLPAIVRDKVEAGEAGLRDGKGFYDYADVDVAAYQRETLRKLVDLLNHLNLIPRVHGAVREE